MSKNNKKRKTTQNDSEVSTAAKWGGLFLLIIMVLSIAGFALSSGSGFQSDENQANKQNFPLTENAFQNPNTGETYWGAIMNGEQFVFLNGIEGYESQEQIKQIALKLKTKQNLTIQISENYQNQDALYLIQEKLLPAMQINYQLLNQNQTCNENTLVFTTNQTKNPNNCIEFITPQGEESTYAEMLIYHILKLN